MSSFKRMCQVFLLAEIGRFFTFIQCDCGVVVGGGVSFERGRTFEPKQGSPLFYFRVRVRCLVYK